MPYDAALQLATHLHRRGQLEAAEQIYRALHDAMPDDPNPMHFLGVVRHRRGGEEGLELVRRSIAIDPSVASWYNNLGNILLDRGEVDDASMAYARCAELDPGNFEVLNNLGVLLRKLRRYDEAEETLKRAVAMNGTFVKARTNLASLYYDQRRIKEGHAHIAAVLEHNPGDATGRKILGVLYATLGRLDEAAKIFREWLDHEPGNEQARHHLAACSPGAMPERASEGYVEQVFDSFAGSFDAKLAALEYRAPQLVGDAVAQLLGAPSALCRIIDAGCGTGLCGPYLKRYAQCLVGVDLSGNMLEHARARGDYTELVKCDLVTYLEQCPPNHDLIVSADTLCYFGRLDSVIKAARKALCRGGHLVFTLEAHADDLDYRLNPHGRYSHNEAYVRRVLSENEFTLHSVKSDQLRTESGKPVEGWILTAQAV